MEDTLPMLHPDANAPRFAAPEGMPSADIAGATDRGREREGNEDHFVVAELDRWLCVRQSSLIEETDSVRAGGTEAVLLAVADGIGGHAGGEMASAVVLDALLNYTALVMPWLGRDGQPGTGAELAAAVEACQERLSEVAEQLELAGSEPGTTLTAAYVTWPTMLVVHVGDSRCYLLRDDELVRLTRDHTLAQEIADHQGLDQDAAATLPYAHILNNAVGGGDPQVRPDVGSFELRPGDSVLLCTDGLTGMISDEGIAEILAEAPTAAEACARLLARANRAGGRDNITAIVARY